MSRAIRLHTPKVARTVGHKRPKGSPEPAIDPAAPPEGIRGSHRRIVDIAPTTIGIRMGDTVIDGYG